MSDLTIDNLEKGEKTLGLSQGSDKGKGGLERFYEKNKNKIFKLTEDEEIDCNKYNYYYETCQPFKFGGWCFAEKIDSIFGCNSEVKRYNRKYLYKVERKNRPTGEKLKSGFTSLFKKSADATPAPADNAAPTPVTNTDANAAPADNAAPVTNTDANAPPAKKVLHLLRLPPVDADPATNASQKTSESQESSASPADPDVKLLYIIIYVL